MFRFPQCFAGAFAVVLSLGLTAPVFADVAKGTVKTVHTDLNTLVIKGITSDTTYHLTKDAWVILDGRRVKLGDLTLGDKAYIDFAKQNDRLVATGARCFRNGTETTGTVKHLYGDKNEIVLKGVLKDTTYDMDKKHTIYLNGKESNFSDLREGDEVALTWLKQGDRMLVTEVRATRR